MDSLLSILAIASVVFWCWWRINHRLPLPPSGRSKLILSLSTHILIRPRTCIVDQGAVEGVCPVVIPARSVFPNMAPCSAEANSFRPSDNVYRRGTADHRHQYPPSSNRTHRETQPLCVQASFSNGRAARSPQERRVSVLRRKAEALSEGPPWITQSDCHDPNMGRVSRL